MVARRVLNGTAGRYHRAAKGRRLVNGQRAKAIVEPRIVGQHVDSYGGVHLRGGRIVVGHGDEVLAFLNRYGYGSPIAIAIGIGYRVLEGGNAYVVGGGGECYGVVAVHHGLALLGRSLLAEAHAYGRISKPSIIVQHVDYPWRVEASGHVHVVGYRN